MSVGTSIVVVLWFERMTFYVVTLSDFHHIWSKGRVHVTKETTREK